MVVANQTIGAAAEVIGGIDVSRRDNVGPDNLASRQLVLKPFLDLDRDVAAVFNAQRPITDWTLATVQRHGNLAGHRAIALLSKWHNSEAPCHRHGRSSDLHEVF